jgi:hypothetical protein
MVCVVIVGIAAAIALPSILPLRASTNLQGACDGLASMLARARLEAMVQKRCTRVRVAATSVVVEALASFDCDQTPLRPPFLPPATGQPSPWIAVARLDSSSDERFAVDAVPPPGPGGVAGELRFRPSGRVFSQDANVANDAALVSVSGPSGKLSVLVQGNGLVCRLGGKAPLTGPAGLECP